MGNRQPTGNPQATHRRDRRSPRGALHSLGRMCLTCGEAPHSCSVAATSRSCPADSNTGAPGAPASARSLAGLDTGTPPNPPPNLRTCPPQANQPNQILQTPRVYQWGVNPCCIPALSFSIFFVELFGPGSSLPPPGNYHLSSQRVQRLEAGPHF